MHRYLITVCLSVAIGVILKRRQLRAVSPMNLTAEPTASACVELFNIFAP